MNELRRREVFRRETGMRRFPALASALFTASLLVSGPVNAEKSLIPENLRGQTIVFEPKPKAGKTRMITFGENGIIEVKTVNERYDHCSTEKWKAGENPDKTVKIVEEAEDGLEVKTVGKIRNVKLEEKKAAKLEDIPEDYRKYLLGHFERLCNVREIEKTSEVKVEDKAEKSINEMIKAESGVGTLEAVLWGISGVLVLAVLATAGLLRRFRPNRKEKKGIGREVEQQAWTVEIDE